MGAIVPVNSAGGFVVIASVIAQFHRVLLVEKYARAKSVRRMAVRVTGLRLAGKRRRAEDG